MLLFYVSYIAALRFTHLSYFVACIFLIAVFCIYYVYRCFPCMCLHHMCAVLRKDRREHPISLEL